MASVPQRERESTERLTVPGKSAAVMLLPVLVHELQPIPIALIAERFTV